MTAPFAPVRLPPARLVEAAAGMGRAVVDDPLFVCGGGSHDHVSRHLETTLHLGFVPA